MCVCVCVWYGVDLYLGGWREMGVGELENMYSYSPLGL